MITYKSRHARLTFNLGDRVIWPIVPGPAIRRVGTSLVLQASTTTLEYKLKNWVQ